MRMSTKNKIQKGQKEYDLLKSGGFRYPSMEKSDETEGKMAENVLAVYETVIVDRESCTVIKQNTSVGTDADHGLLDIELTRNEKDNIKKGKFVVFSKIIGMFTPWREVDLNDAKIVKKGG
jgi:hypothetical protein